MLDELERHLADNYWSWATDVCLNLDDSKPVSAMPVSADTYAWRLAAHFRASGLSDGWMVNFANFHLKFEQEPRSLADVVASAQRTALAGSGWLFLVPLESRRGFNISTNDTFLTPKDFETEFTGQFPGIDVPENRGGLRLVEDQIDKYAAIEGARRQLTGLLERLGASGTPRRRLGFPRPPG